MIPENICNPEILKFMIVPNPKYYDAIKRGIYNYHKPTMTLGIRGHFAPPGAAYWSFKEGHGKLPLAELPPLVRESPTFELRPEQVPIFETAKITRAGIIEFKTGGGKSVIMIALTQCWGGKTLILVHALDMVQQFYDKFKEFAGIEIGRYNTNHKDIKDITVTTFHSARNNKQMFLGLGFDNLIIDEADAFFTDKARDFICRFGGHRTFGFTATTRSKFDDHIPKADLHAGHAALFRFYGLRITAGKGSATTVSPLSNTKTMVSDGTPCVLAGIRAGLYYADARGYKDEFGLAIRPQDDWHKFRKALQEDEKRTQEQMSFVRKNHESGRDFSLVLFDRVADAIDAQAHFAHNNRKERTYLIHGSCKKSDRERSKTEFLEHGGIMFAQYQTSSRGIDYPECNKIFLLFPSRGETVLRQAIGRAIRWMPNKKAYVYDFVDNTLLYQWKARKKIYEEFFPDVPITLN